MRLQKLFERFFTISNIFALLVGPILVPVAQASHVDGRTTLGHYAVGEGAIQSARENPWVELSITDNIAYPGARLTDVTRDGDHIELEKTGQASVNTAGLYAGSDGLLAALGVVNIIEYDVASVDSDDPGTEPDVVYLAFVTINNQEKRLLRFSKWTAADGWRGVGGGRHDQISVDGEQQPLEGVKSVQLRTSGTDINIFFADEEIGDVYRARWTTITPRWVLNNISDNPAQSEDFRVSENGEYVIWIDNRTNSDFKGDLYVSRLAGNAFSAPKNVTGGRSNRGELEFSLPSIEFHHGIFYATAKSPQGRYKVISGNEAELAGFALNFSDERATPFSNLRLFDIERATDILVVAEDSDGISLYRMGGAGQRMSRIEGAHKAQAVVAAGSGTLAYQLGSDVYVQRLRVDQFGLFAGPDGDPAIMHEDGATLTPLEWINTTNGYVLWERDGQAKVLHAEVIWGNRSIARQVIATEQALTFRSVPLGGTGMVDRNNAAILGSQKILFFKAGLSGLQTRRDVAANSRVFYKPRGEFTSGKLNTGPEPVRRIELVATQLVSEQQRIDYQVSNDGGATWHAVWATNFGIFDPPNPGNRDMHFDFPAEGNDLRVKATLSSDNPLTTPTIRFLRAAYYKVEQNQPPTVNITGARQIPGLTRTLIEYTASDPNGARGSLTAEYQNVQGAWQAMAYFEEQTNDPRLLPIAERQSSFQFMWNVGRIGREERPVPIRFRVSDGTLSSPYAESRVAVDTRAPQIADFRVGAVTPDTVAVRWDPALDANFDHYNVFHLRLPFPALDGRQITCQNVAQEPFTSLAIEQARPRSIRNAGNNTSVTLQSLFSDTCYVVFLEGYDTFGNHSLAPPVVTRTARPVIPQTPQIAVVSMQQQTAGLVDIDYTITDSDSRSFTVGGTVAFIDSAGRAQTIALHGDSLNRHGHNGANVSFPDDQPGSSRQFRFVWDARSELLRYAITDTTQVDITLQAVDSDGVVGIGPQQRVAVDGLAPRLDPVVVSNVTFEGARVRWQPAADANFSQYKLWLGNTAAAARFHPDQFVALLNVINNRETSELTFRGRLAGRTYYFCLEAFDRVGNQSTSQCGEFTTVAQQVNNRPRLVRGGVLNVGLNSTDFEVFVSDPNGDNVRLSVDYSTDQLQWHQASGVDRNQLYDGYAVHTLQWHHRQDIQNYIGQVWLRVVAEDGGRLQSDPPLVLGPINLNQPPQWAGDLTIDEITTESARVSWQAADGVPPLWYRVSAFFPAVGRELVFTSLVDTTSALLSGLASGSPHGVSVLALDGLGGRVEKTKSFTTAVAVVPINNPSVLINNGKVTVDSNVVSLTLAAGGADEVWVSNNEDFSSGNWQAFAETLRWELLVAGATPERVVYAKFRNASGTVSPVVRDSVNFVPPDDDASADVKVGDEETVDVVVSHDQKHYYGPGDQVRLRAEAVGGVAFDSINFFVDGKAVAGGVCATSPCEVLAGPFKSGRRTYWAVIVPQGGKLDKGIRSQVGSFVIEKKDLTVTASVSPANPYAGGTIEIVAVVRAGRDLPFGVVGSLNGEIAPLNCRELNSQTRRCARSVELGAGDYVFSVAVSLGGVELQQSRYAFTVRPARNPAAPTIDIAVNPAAPAVDEGVSVVATTQGNVNYRTITLTLDENRVKQCAGSPCEYFIPAGTMAVGDHAIVARTDGAPLAEARQSITVRAAQPDPPDAPPTTQIVIAPDRPTADGLIVVTVGIDGGFDRIELLVDNQVVQTCVALPCTLATQLTEGAHTVTARVTYTRNSVSGSVESTRQVVIAAGAPPEPEEGGVLVDRAPESVELVVDPDNQTTAGERVTVTARVTGEDVRVERIEIYEGTVGEERLVETCRGVAACSYAFTANVVGVHSFYAKVFYQLGDEVEEFVSDAPLFTVVTREDAARQDLDAAAFDAQNGTAEASGVGPQGVLVTDSNSVRIASNGTNLCFMRFAIDPSFTGAPWAPFDPSYDFPLPAGEGEVIIYLQYKSCSGNESDVLTRRVVRSTAQLASSDPRQTGFGQGGGGGGGAGAGGGGGAATLASVIRTFSFECSDASRPRDATLMNRLAGRILLAVERKGEGFYLFRKDPKKSAETCGYYLGRPTHAFSVMRFLGLGISTSDLGRAFANFSTPKPGDRAVFTARDRGLLQRFAGKILLQVEAKGEAYYVSPIDLKGYYLGRPADAFRVMRELGLGIGNANLGKIPLFAEILKAKP